MLRFLNLTTYKILFIIKLANNIIFKFKKLIVLPNKLFLYLHRMNTIMVNNAFVL